MNLKSPMFIGAVLLAANFAMAGNDDSKDQNTILALVLKKSFPDGGYRVVKPEAGMWSDYTGDAKDIAQTKKYIIENLATNGAVAAELFDRLSALKKHKVRLTIKSSPQDGYIIDYDGTYAAYFKKGGGGWLSWDKEHSNAHGFTTVSLPAYDPKTGSVLIYIGTQTGALSGAGWLILYSYKDGELKELGRVNIWIS